MMRLPRFRFVAPRTVGEAAAALAEAPADTAAEEPKEEPTAEKGRTDG